MHSATFAAIRKWVDAWLDRPWPILSSIGYTFAVLRKRFEKLDDWLDAWADRNWPLLSAIGYMVIFAVFFGGVALAAYRSGLAARTGALCGPMCLAIPGLAYATAALWGAAAILFVKLHVQWASAVERWFVDALFYKPLPLMPKGGVRLAVVLFNLIGVALFVALVAFELTLRSKTTNAPFVLLIAWIWGGRRVLGFFWPKRPERWGITIEQPMMPPRRMRPN
jgi:hypothetical protein